MLKKDGHCLLLHQVHVVQTRAEIRITDKEKVTSQLENTDSGEIKTIETGLEDVNKVENIFSFPCAELEFEGLSHMKVDTETLVSKKKI
ncbi:hypothetical protein AVEN_10056-1 [Araneus ventricosus]|uniref:Uncharacterized protein n=1 Tax=Araneus ventricosus TaxID=182803 RepID=A0A4Y2NVE0_ARAVE|nr:hypothetical protein AVEN_10056-1 [Araneus ventricosus]